MIVSSRKVTRQWRDIAIIGMTGRFPGGGGVDQLWHNLEIGKDCITHFTDDELLQAGVPRHLVKHPHYVKAAPLLADYDRFDAELFNFAPSEAALIDPQHRIFLECAWEAMELAGYSTRAERLRTAVFAGSALNTYLMFGLLEELRDNFIPTLIANNEDFLATRVSHRLNLTGPSATIQTACSTSLVAIHFACASLINGEADLALAGGVAVKVPHVAGHMYRAGSMVSRDGRCRSFDAAERSDRPVAFVCPANVRAGIDSIGILTAVSARSGVASTLALTIFRNRRRWKRCEPPLPASLIRMTAAHVDHRLRSLVSSF